jgi:hypothetical protein
MGMTNITQQMIDMIRTQTPTMVAQQITGVQPITGSVGSIFNTTEMRWREWGFLGHNKKYWPYQYSITAWSMVDPVERWCYENFKSRNWRNVGRHFAFKRHEDAAFFTLKWGM